MKVNPEDDLLTWFSPIDEEVKIHLHFCYEDYLKDHEKLRKEIQRLELGGYKNRIVLDYEGLDRKTMSERAKKLYFESEAPIEPDPNYPITNETWKELPNMKLVDQDINHTVSVNKTGTAIKNEFKEVNKNETENKPKRKRKFKMFDL